MILIIKKDKIVLIGLVFLLSLALISINIASGQNAVEVANDNAVKRTVVIDAGHGGEDPGAVSDYSGLKEILEAENFNVIMTREEDVLKYKEGTQGYTSKRGQDLTARKKLIDESGAQSHGAQVFFPPRSEESKKLADCIQKSLRENVDPDNKREALVKDTKLIILRNLKVPTVIVECGFLSNREEEKKLADKEYQEKLAQAIKEGIVKYFEQQ